MRIVAVYMPHGGHSNAEVEEIYAQLDVECMEAVTKGEITVIAGDFNADVGCRNECDNVSIIGDIPIAPRSDRCRMLMQWWTLRNTSDGACKYVRLPFCWGGVDLQKRERSKTARLYHDGYGACEANRSMQGASLR